MAAMSSSQTQMTPQQTNLLARQTVLATAERMNQNIGTMAAQLNGTPANLNGVATLRQKLFNVGLITSLDLVVTMSVNITAAAQLAKRGPWNLFSAIRVKDFDGTDRINASGYQIWANRGIRTRLPHMLTLSLNAPAVDFGQVYPLVVVPTAVGNNQNVSFRLRVPVCYDPESDLTGALLAQATTGELYIEADLNPSVFGVDEDGVYTSGAGTINSVSVTVIQNYLAPAGVGNSIVLPLLDLNTVYELNGSLKTNSDINAGLEKLINIPNYRTVLSVLIEYLNGGVLNPGSDITQLRWLIGGNLPLRQYSAFDLAAEVRQHLGWDLPDASYYLTTRFKPIDTSLYGNVQIGVTPSLVNAGNTYIKPLIESFYPKGAVLSGLSQGA